MASTRAGAKALESMSDIRDGNGKDACCFMPGFKRSATNVIDCAIEYSEGGNTKTQLGAMKVSGAALAAKNKPISGSIRGKSEGKFLHTKVNEHLATATTKAGAANLQGMEIFLRPAVTTATKAATNSAGLASKIKLIRDSVRDKLKEGKYFLAKANDRPTATTKADPGNLEDMEIFLRAADTTATMARTKRADRATQIKLITDSVGVEREEGKKIRAKVHKHLAKATKKADVGNREGMEIFLRAAVTTATKAGTNGAALGDKIKRIRDSVRVEREGKFLLAEVNENLATATEYADAGNREYMDVFLRAAVTVATKAGTCGAALDAKIKLIRDSVRGERESKFLFTKVDEHLAVATTKAGAGNLEGMEIFLRTAVATATKAGSNGTALDSKIKLIRDSLVKTAAAEMQAQAGVNESDCIGSGGERAVQARDSSNGSSNDGNLAAARFAKKQGKHDVTEKGHTISAGSLGEECDAECRESVACKPHAIEPLVQTDASHTEDAESFVLSDERSARNFDSMNVSMVEASSTLASLKLSELDEVAKDTYKISLADERSGFIGAQKAAGNDSKDGLVSASFEHVSVSYLVVTDSDTAPQQCSTECAKKRAIFGATNSENGSIDGNLFKNAETVAAESEGKIEAGEEEADGRSKSTMPERNFTSPDGVAPIAFDTAEYADKAIAKACDSVEGAIGGDFEHVSTSESVQIDSHGADDKLRAALELVDVEGGVVFVPDSCVAGLADSSLETLQISDRDETSDNEWTLIDESK